MRRLLNFAAFYVGWITCVAGAAHGRPRLGPTVATLILIVHLSTTATPKAEARLIGAAGLMGFVVETVFISVGLYTITTPGTWPWLCPPWMVALWLIFATTLDESLAWISGRYALAALLGALAGPVSYLGGARLGAIVLHPNVTVSIIGIALAWAMVMPALLWLQQRFRRPSSPLTIGWTIG